MKLTNSIIGIAIKAGEGILNIYNDNNQNIDITFKDDNSPLTKADQASNKIICKFLKQLTPDIPIFTIFSRYLIIYGSCQVLLSCKLVLGG